MSRLDELSAMQQALLQKMKALDAAEAESIEAQPQPVEEPQDAAGVFEMLQHKQQELQKMRSAIGECASRHNPPPPHFATGLAPRRS